jgi:UDP-N-acetylmuramoyl-tripeptide--D-alanyl-D-alanine ligase
MVITEGCIDSRQVIPGALFVALPGERVDGHTFVSSAFERGAVAALVQSETDSTVPVINLCQPLPAELPVDAKTLQEGPVCLRVPDALLALQQVARFWRHKLNVRVIGITGSVGKSTTKELVAEVLSQRYRTLKTTGNFNNEIGLPLMLLSLSEGHERAVLEMGFYVLGEITFLCDLALPSIGVLTNIGTVHAERAGSQETIAQGKAELVQALPAAPDGVAILNYDDPLVREMASKTRAQVFYYGLDPNADLWADQVEGLGLEGIRFRLHYQGETLYLRVPMIGRHSVHTALRAAAVGLVEGLDWQEIINGLRTGTSQLRLVAVRTESGALLLDDTYNASPESVMAALNLLDELYGRKIAVLGDMLELGQYEAQGHEMVGIRAAEVVSQLVTVGERGRMIADAAHKAGLVAAAITPLETTQQATEWLKQRLEPRDVVLVKGSHGMRMDKIVSALETSG